MGSLSVFKEQNSRSEIAEGNTKVKEQFLEETSTNNKSKACAINKSVLLLKLNLFLYYGGYASLSSFFIIFLKQKGLNATQLALVYTLNPIIQVIYQMGMGVLSDKTGKYKLILLGNLLGCVLFSNILLVVPDKPLKIYNQNISSRNWNHSSCLDVLSYNCNSSMETLDYNYSFFNESKETLENSIEDAEFSPTMSVMVFLIAFSLVKFLCLSMTYRSFDVTAMTMVKQHNSDYGKQRLWCIAGQVIMPAVSGYAVQRTSPPDGPKNCLLAFIIFDVSALFIVAGLWKMKVSPCKFPENVWSTVLLFVKNLDNLVFFIVLLISGSCWYFFNIFSTYYVDELKISGLILGIKASLSGVFGIPAAFYSDWLISKIGIKQVFFLALLTHCLQAVSYSYMENPLWCLPIELGNVFTYHLMWIAVVRNAYEIAPKGLAAVVITSAGAIHYTVGKGVGSSIGGFLMGKYGGRFAFRTMASISGTAAALYLAYLIFVQFRRRKKAIEQYIN